ncbi:helix-turn-helix transcriptional regulator [Corynebacterium coyleae]|uniref:HTH cro/C1-type domain-containing protein n=1 Tax=Corynebacterium coyleae TaxID=53374 RepID=A0AAP6XLB6_9CORY|nr:hypothetical protein [Corynebacterium coyleae]NJJ04431.1 hypothetical protein [Corynebacterium coyleae]PLA37141.1 hypothetical protein CYJ46_10080 [Corynebacterium coyleae]
MTTQPLAEAFPVGDYLAEELEARGWSEEDFAEILGQPTTFVEALISGQHELTRESAALVGAALGTSAELWLNLQDTYLRWKQSHDSVAQERLANIRERARHREVSDLRRAQ